MIRASALSAALLGLLAAPSIAAHHEGGLAYAAHHEDAERSEAPSPLPVWDQDDVSDLARKLQNSINRLRALERSAPQDSIASGQALARERYRQRLRTLWAECRSLADNVRKGKTREETGNLFGRIQEIWRDVTEEARRMFFSREALDEIQKAEGLVSELRIYYKGAPEPYPALVGPSKDDKKAEDE